MNRRRRQLTLFVEGEAAATLEQIRQKFNPAQHELIAAHATLCREDEIEAQIEQVIFNLENLVFEKIELFFGQPIRFSEGAGVLLPSVGDDSNFQNLRKKVLAGVVESPRRQLPHLTLMHPRNSVCTAEIFEQILEFDLPCRLVFQKISLIEQVGSGRWRVLRGWLVP